MQYLPQIPAGDGGGGGGSGTVARLSGAGSLVLVIGLMGICLCERPKDLRVFQPPAPTSIQYKKGCEMNNHPLARKRCLEQRERRATQPTVAHE